MNLKIRCLGIIIAEKDLVKNQVYYIGRDKSCEIRLTKDFISRKHAKVYFESGKWWYQDLRVNHPRYIKEKLEISDNSSLDFENNIDIFTENYLNNHETNVYKLDDLKKSKKEPHFLVKLSMFIFLSVLIGGVYYKYDPLKLIKMSPQEIQVFSSKRFVSFQLKKDLQIEEQIQKVSNLTADDFLDDRGYCSGFIIQKKILLTALHCLLGENGVTPVESYELKTFDNKKHKIDSILGISYKHDMALLEVGTLVNYPFFKISNNHTIGENIYTIGNVHGEGIAIREGTISSMTKDINDPTISYLRFSAGTSPGNSGGPLVNQNGEVLGLVFAQANSAENYNYAAPYSTILSFLKTHLDVPNSRSTLRLSDNKYNSSLIEHYYEFNFINKNQKDFIHLNDENNDLSKVLNRITFELDYPINYKSFKDFFMEAKINQMGENIISMNKNSLLLTNWDYKSINNSEVYSIDEEFIEIKEVNKKHISESIQKLLSPIKNNKLGDTLLSSKVEIPFIEKSIKDETSFYTSITEETQIELEETYTYISKAPNLPLEITFKKVLDHFPNLLINLRNIQYPFIRPKAYQNVPLKNFKISDVSEVLDKKNRKWNKAQIIVTSELKINIFCHDYPQGLLCLTKPMKGSKYYQSLKEISYIRNQLSELRLAPRFWSAKEITKINNLELADINLKKKKKKYHLSYQKTGIRFKYLKDPSHFKIYNTPYKDMNGNVKWVTYAHDAFFQKTKKSNAKICKTQLGSPLFSNSKLEKDYKKLKEIESISIGELEHKLKRVKSKRSKRKLKRIIANIKAKKSPTKVKLYRKKSILNNKVVNIYSACQEVFEDEYTKDYLIDDNFMLLNSSNYFVY